MSAAPHLEPRRPMVQLSEAESTLFVLMGERGEGKLFGKVVKRSDREAWRIDVRPHGYIYGIGGVAFATKDTADAILNMIRIRIVRGEDAETACAEFLQTTATGNQVATIYAKWLDVKRAQVRSGERSPRTVQEYERYARAGGELSFWGRRSILAVTSDELDVWNAWLSDRGLSPKTRRSVIGALRTCYRWASRSRRLREPVWPSIDVPEHSPNIIAPETQDAILAACPEEDRGAHLIACHMGLRPGEIRALRPSDYSRGPGAEFAVLRVARAMKGHAWNAPIGATKTKRNRSLPCPAIVSDWIEARWDAAARLAADEDAPLLVNPRTGKRWSHWALRQSWLQACKAAKVPAVPYYEGTKHSGATAMLARTKDLEAVREYLGHSDARSTRKYAHLTSGAMVSIVQGRGGVESNLSLSPNATKPDDESGAESSS